MTNSLAAGMVVAVAASNLGSSLSGVSSSTSSSVKLPQSQAADTLPGPAAPPFSITDVALKAISQASLLVGSSTLTTALFSRSTNAQPAVASTVRVRISSPPTGPVGTSSEQAIADTAQRRKAAPRVRRARADKGIGK